MRYSIMTIHGEDDIEVTATMEKDSEKFLSHKIMSRIVLHVEQYRTDGLAAMSVLLSDSGTVSLLKKFLPERFCQGLF